MAPVVHSLRLRGLLLAALAAASFAAAAAGCSKGPPVTMAPTCPNRVPVEGGACEPGLSCTYFDASGCVETFEATCSADGVWVMEGRCAAGGAGGVGASTGGADGGGGGGEGGAGGTACVDPVAGPPTVVSPSAAIYPPDTTMGRYRLELSEAATGVTTRLLWSGPGTIDDIDQVGSKRWDVTFSGVAPGESAVLTLEPGAVDTCGNELNPGIDIDITLLPRCHLFAEDFEGDWLGSGWTVSDEAGDGNVWDRNDLLDAPNGVPNHTFGSGLCAAADDISTAATSAWDSGLHAPPVDLSSAENAVLTYQSDFSAPAGVGEAWLEASTDGFAWSPLSQWSDSQGPGRELVDLSAWLGGSLLLRWRYHDELGAGGWWDVDDVCVESFTEASCPCPGGAFAETLDFDGGFDGNGLLATAELTGVTLGAIGEQVTVCGLLEDAASSGPDFFTFWVDGGTGSGQVRASVDFCLENPFEDAIVEVWRKSVIDPIATFSTAHGEGSFDVNMIDGAQYFLSVRAAGGAYTAADYTLKLTIDGMMTPILAEGFEFWPPFSLLVADEDPCLDWAQAPGTVVPSGELPTEGFSLAYFNSYDCPTGSESLETDVLSLSNSTTVLLSFDMFHDPGYPGSNDSIQVQYDDGNDWIDIGLPVLRPGPVPAWETATINLSALAGMSSLRLRLYATTAYGNNIHIDNVLLMAD